MPFDWTSRLLFVRNVGIPIEPLLKRHPDRAPPAIFINGEELKLDGHVAAGSGGSATDQMELDCDSDTV
jgi:hypothetical protein